MSEEIWPHTKLRKFINPPKGFIVARLVSELPPKMREQYREGHKVTPKCFEDWQWRGWKEAVSHHRATVSTLSTYCDAPR